MTNQPISAAPPALETSELDVVVVGAGIGGLYALHRFRQQGLRVLGLEGASGVGGVWFHNRYPGARVDIDSTDYSYHFSADIYREWKWTERYASQEELLRYLNFVADRLDIRRLIQFKTWLTKASWKPDVARWLVETSDGTKYTTRFLVMATGNLSAARKPDFDGLDDFAGEWVQASHWPDREVAIAGHKIALIGTGSSGVQCAPKLAEQASHLYVLQRSPNYSVPAQNCSAEPVGEAVTDELVSERRRALFATIGASKVMTLGKPLSHYTSEEALAQLEHQWATGGHGMSYLFADQGTNASTNEVVAEFVRSKIRSIVEDTKTAEALSPRDHPIGSRRLCLDSDYYETFNRPNVTLIDVRNEPIERITATGVKTRDRLIEVDLIVFALGFHAFSGAMQRVDIRNERGEHPTDAWARGPQTLLGLMTANFPNFFFLTGPGSPSVLSNLFLMNEYHVDWVADCIAYLDRHGFRTIEPTERAQAEWTAHVAAVAAPTLRNKTINYMVHRDEEGRGTFIPYIGGFSRYVAHADDVAARGYVGFALN